MIKPQIIKWCTVSIVLVLFTWALGSYYYVIRSHDESHPRDTMPVNTARLITNKSMVYLEENFSKMKESLHQEMLDSIAQEGHYDVLIASIDGAVIYNTDSEDLRRKIDLKTSLLYNIDKSSMNQEQFEHVFPIIDQSSEWIVGHAIFTLPTTALKVDQINDDSFISYVFFNIVVIMLILSIVYAGVTIQKRLIAPIHQLRYHTESILKGNYNDKADYSRYDEVGECYAAFDQMRLEIKHLNEYRIRQEQSQKELISNISHDLKTPLTTIKAYMEAIQAGVCPDLDAVMEYIHVMEANANQMARLLDDLLHHALRELGHISVNLREQYSKPSFERMLHLIRYKIALRQVTYEGPTEIPNCIIRIDEHRIEQVIANLIDNALKHTQEGDTVSVRIIQEHNHLTVSIADTGKGIAPEHMPFIFQRYYRAQTEAAAIEPVQDGTGLGLSICKTIVEAHGGRITFHSSKDTGTVFTFTLPMV